MRGLAEYRAKRDFAKTKEPKGEVKSGKSGQRYLIQMHAARRLHYDFRLEWKGVLKSWAVPRGPSLDPQDKRLAVQVEDHPLAYGTFEGTIPKGEYGGGTVMLWDEGTWAPKGDVEAGLKKGHLEFVLHGKRLKGSYHLLRLRGKNAKNNKGEKENWLLVKGKDEYAHPGDGDYALRQATSVKTKRNLDQIAKDQDRQWHSDRGEVRIDTQKKTRPIKKPEEPAKKKAKGHKASLPAFIAPQLTMRMDEPPSSADWIHEIKFDGYRIGARIDHADKKRPVRILTRSGLDWTDRFKSLAAALATLPCKSAYLDGEVVAVDENGLSHFAALQDALSSGEQQNLVAFFFDLLYFNGEDLRSLPLLERKARLESLLGSKKQGRLRYSDHFETEGPPFLKSACALALEGIISKQKTASYASGRTSSWVKAKCVNREEYVIGGYTPSRTGRGIGSILVGHYRDEILTYDGRSGTGFGQKLAESLEKKFRQMRIPKPPFVGLRPADRRRAIWIKPVLVAEIQHNGRSSDGLLRQASFLGLREDKPSVEVIGDRHLSKKGNIVAGITITHPGRVIDPTIGASKLDLAMYYERIAPLMLPEIINRPLSVIRCPDGINGGKFFQRHPQATLRQASSVIDPKDNEPLIAISDEKGLINLIQFGVIEIHPWPAKIHDLDHADRMIFDLDPDPSVSFADVIKAAHELRQRLKDLGLLSFAKITGGKGVHVVLPLKPAIPWVQLKAIAKAIAQQMVKEAPNRFTATMSKAKRQGRIFVDYLRNDRTATAIGIYSARIRPGLPIAVPLNWAQLRTSLKPAPFSINSKNLQMPEEWLEIDKIRQGFKARALRQIGIS